MEQSSKRGRDDDDEDALREEATGESALRPQQVSSAPSPTTVGDPMPPTSTPTIPNTVTPPEGTNTREEMPGTFADETTPQEMPTPSPLQLRT
jgi:hypothetical protein